MPFNEISGQTLEMVVFDFDRFGKHDQIGQVSVQLGKIDLATTIEKTVDIESPPVRYGNEKGLNIFDYHTYLF